MRWAGAGSSCSHIAAGGSLAVDVLGVGSAVSGVLWHCEARLARLYCSNCETRAQSLLLRVAGGCCLAEAHDDGHGKRDDELCGAPRFAPSLSAPRRSFPRCKGAHLGRAKGPAYSRHVTIRLGSASCSADERGGHRRQYCDDNAGEVACRSVVVSGIGGGLAEGTSECI